MEKHAVPCRVLFFFLLFVLMAPSVVLCQDEASQEKFTLEFRDTELREVLRYLARESGRNIIVPDDLKQKVTLSLDEINLDDALSVILKSYGLGFVTDKGVVRITKSIAEPTGLPGEEIVTEIIRLNYANAPQLLDQVKGLLSDKGAVAVDKRSNSLIVKDVRSRIDELRKLMKELDFRVPQVLIKARIVEAGSSFSRSLGIQWGGRYSSSGNTYTGGMNLDIAPSGNNFAVNLPATEPTSGIGMSIGSISDNLTLDVQLSAAEDRGQINIVSTPSITTVNNTTATISSGIELNIRTSTIAGGASTDTGTEEVTAETKLTVTPQISPDNYILLAIEATRDELDFTRVVDGIPAKLNKNATTTVLVKDGDTTVIGGLYKTKKENSRSEVPYLSRIPVLGWLFKSKDSAEEKEELLIFITPTVIKEQT